MFEMGHFAEVDVLQENILTQKIITAKVVTLHAMATALVVAVTRDKVAVMIVISSY
jgi:hypothetical protein